MTHSRIYHLTQRYVAARERAAAARAQGDDSGYRIARADAARCRRALAEA